jgi:predicted MFS family arabinose efflux permease
VSVPAPDLSHEGPQLTPAWVVIGLAMGPAVAIGLARFAYALLLPPMRADLGWSFAQAGAINTVNAAGYLIGAVTAAPLGSRMGDKAVFAVGLVLTAIAVGASALTADFTLLLTLRAAAGFTGALAFVCGAGLTSVAAAGGSKSRAPTFLAIYFAGAGAGVIASALAVPPLLDSVGWRGGWLVLGALALASTAFGLLALRRAPQAAPVVTGAARGAWSVRFMMCVLVAYGLFGAGYIAYVTFIIAFLRSAEGFSSADVTRFWSVLGLSSVAAAFIWGRVLAQLKGGWGVAATLGVLVVGTAAPLVWSTPAGAYLSAVLFGGSFLAVLTAVASFARRALKPHAVTGAIGTLTVVFGIGQCIGPVLSGALADGPSGLKAGLWLSVAILALGVVVAAFQREPGEQLGG